MLKLFFHSDDPNSHGANLVTEASNLLEVGEFQLFQLGYAAWFGRDAQEKQLEGVFFDYMLKNEVPFWARHYARKIIDLEHSQKLTPYDPAYHQYDSWAVKPETRLSGVSKFIAIVVSAIIIFVVFSIGAVSIMPSHVQCWFPPCYWDDQEAPVPTEKPPRTR